MISLYQLLHILCYVKCLSYEDESRRSIRCPVTIIDIYSRENQRHIYNTCETKTSALFRPISPGTYYYCSCAIIMISFIFM